VNTKRPLKILEDELAALGCRKILMPDKGQFGLTQLSRIPWDATDGKNESGFRRRRITYEADVPANIVQTSGSSGRPKAVVLSVGNHYYSGLGSNRHIPMTGHDAWLVSLPVYHVSGVSILWRSFLAGAAVVLGGPKRDISACLRQFPVTHLSLVPVQLQSLLQQHRLEDRLKKLKAVLLGGSSVPPELVRSAIRKKIPVFASYGLTEMSSQVATTVRIRHMKALTQARVLPYRKIQISDADEICVCGKTLCLGFMKRRKVHTVVDSGGWYHTGDRGRLNKEGRLEVWGRLDLMFVSGGENIYPEEIERALLSLPEVAAAVVVPMACATFGWRPTASVQFHRGARLTPAQLRNGLSSRLEKYKIPDVFYHWP
ncbi:MAG: AMP-binding protein, partial [Candidatus Omnitrophica bacterium]|nr:AMP-binding protein [Candidatus Omnitrophota bacterium]